jgi:hypothetical protein
MASPPPDPAALFRQMLGEWEKAANQVGGDWLKSDAFARAMHGANAASLGGQQALQEVMERALAAANMPSRAEVEDLSARLGRIEAQLARIEAAVAPPAAATSAAPPPKPTRTRKPPAAG